MDKNSSSHLGKEEAEILNSLISNLACAYRTLVELLEYYDRMSYFDIVDRLDSMQEWMEQALQQLVWEKQVEAWEAEAKSQSYSPFAL